MIIRIKQRKPATGITDPEKVFYSFRTNMGTALENAGVPENRIMQILGHKKQSISLSRYSEGVDLKALAKELAKVDYGKRVEALVKRGGLNSVK